MKNISSTNKNYVYIFLEMLRMLNIYNNYNQNFLYKSREK